MQFTRYAMPTGIYEAEEMESPTSARLRRDPVSALFRELQLRNPVWRCLLSLLFLLDSGPLWPASSLGDARGR